MIKSKFYLIRGDGEPIYVGFTNRPIKQRFSEHKADKDFSDYEEITIEKIDELDYEFTWDEDILYKNANEVSVRENQLIIKYGTQDSRYQKASGGGQVWNYEKWFVRTNKDNPKFKDMSGDEIEDWIGDEQAVDRYLSGFVNHMKEDIGRYLSDFINNMKDPVSAYLSNFVNHMKDPVSDYLSNFVNNMKGPVDVYLIHFVNDMKDSIDRYLKDFVGSIRESVDQYLKNFVNHMRDPTSVYLSNFVNCMYEPADKYLINFVGNMKK